MNKISRMDVCRAVPMAPSTFDIWRKSGRLETFTDGTLSNAKKPIVFCTLEALAKALHEDDVALLADRLGLYDEPEPEVTTPDVQIDKNYNDPAPSASISEVPSAKKLNPIEAREEMNRTFAEKYLRGEESDSAGNRIDGSNDRWPLQEGRADEAVTVILTGPQGRAKPEAPEGATTVHADLRGDHQGSWDFDKNSPGTTRKGVALESTYSQTQYDEDLRKWNARGGGLSMREKAERVWARTAAIHAAFPKKDVT